MNTVNNSPQNPNPGNGIWFLLGIILFLLAIFLIIFYGAPLLRGFQGSPQIKVPDKINININQTK